jgi:hypothetical protein
MPRTIKKLFVISAMNVCPYVIITAFFFFFWSQICSIFFINLLVSNLTLEEEKFVLTYSFNACPMLDKLGKLGQATLL